MISEEPSTINSVPVNAEADTSEDSDQTDALGDQNRSPEGRKLDSPPDDQKSQITTLDTVGDDTALLAASKLVPPTGIDTTPSGETTAPTIAELLPDEPDLTGPLDGPLVPLTPEPPPDTPAPEASLDERTAPSDLATAAPVKQVAEPAGSSVASEEPARANAPSIQKYAEDEKPRVTLLTDKVRRQAWAVFVPSPDYERQRRHGLFDQGPRIFVVYGPESAHNFYTAVHLGFEIYGEGKSTLHNIYPITTHESNIEAGPFVRYAKGIQRLSRQWRTHPNYSDLELYEIQMRTAVDQALRFGDTPIITADINRIIDGLSHFDPPLFPEGRNFADYCEGIKARPTNGVAPGKTQIFTLEPAGRETRLLIDYVPVKELQSGAVYIIQDALERGISVSGISPEIAVELEKLLTAGKDNISLILTTTLPDYHLNDLPPKLGRVASFAETRGERDTQLVQIFGEMLRFYRAKDALPDLLYDAIVDRMTTLIKTGLSQPSRIEAFCAKLVGLLDESGGLMEDVDYGARVTQLAERVYVEQASIHDYFQSLPPNHKLYALLAALFDGVDRLFLDELYSILVQVLRQQGLMRLRDPRELGRDDLLERVLLREKPGVESIDFISPAFRQEVRRQTRNYNHLLWSCANHLVGMLENREFRGPEAQEFRRALGVALGQLGVHHRWKFDDIVEKLAHDRSGAIVAVASIALGEICRESPQHQRFVIDLLGSWAKSDDFDLMWAAGASVWRIYDALDLPPNTPPAVNSREPGDVSAVTDERSSDDDQQGHLVYEQLCTILTYLGRRQPNDFKTDALLRALAQIHEVDLDELKRAGPPKLSPFQEALVGQIYKSWTKEVHNSVLVAVDKIALTDVGAVVTLLESWLRDSSSQLRLTGLEAVQRLFAPERYQNAPLLVERHRPLLALIAAVLRADVDMPSVLVTMDTILDTLREWAIRPKWSSWIEETLRKEIDEADTRQVDLLRTCLSARWLDTTAADAANVRILGRRMIARINLLDGVPVDLPGSDYGVIALDASHMMVAQSIQAGRRLHERLSAYIDLVVGRMGQESALLSCGMPLLEERLVPQRGHYYPPLLQPLLETLDPTRNSFVLALAWNPIHDLDDLEESSWSRQMIVAFNPVEQENDWSRRDIMLALDRHTNDPYYLDLIELFQRMQIASQLSTSRGIVFALEQSMSDERSLVVIETLVRVWMARRLVLRDKTVWLSQIDASLQLGVNTSQEERTQAALARVEKWIAQADGGEADGTKTVSLRDALSTILWLAAADLSHCVQVLKNCLGDDRAPARLLGAAGAQSVFAVYAEHQPVPALETYGVLLELAPLLASHGWRSARTVLYAAWRWGIDLAWGNRLAVGADGRPSELMELVAALLPAHRKHLGALLDAWLNPEFLYPLREKDQPREIPLSLRKLAEQIRLRIALSEHRPQDVAASGRSYGLILLDASMPLVNRGRDRDRRQRLAELVSIVTQQLAAAVQNSDLDIVLYHLGHTTPVAEPNVQLAADHILPEELGDRPRLAGPLLDLFQPDQVSFVLLVTNSPVHDLDDVAHGDWRARLYLYRDIDRMRWSHPLREIVVKSTDPRRSLPDVTRVADAIVETLRSELRGA